MPQATQPQRPDDKVLARWSLLGGSPAAIAVSRGILGSTSGYPCYPGLVITGNVFLVQVHSLQLANMTAPDRLASGLAKIEGF